MKVDLRCSVDHGVYANMSLIIEQLPGESDYSYASAWPRMTDYGQILVVAELEPNVVGAATSVIKVASWSNGVLSKRTWDADTIPVEVPPPIEWFENPNSLNGYSSIPVYKTVCHCPILPLVSRRFTHSILLFNGVMCQQLSHLLE